MSERDSPPSSDDTGNTAPRPHKNTENSNETIHSYFIPVVMLIVMGVIIVSTFYSKEFNNLIAGAAPPDQADELTSDATEHSLASSQALDKPAGKTKSNTNTETASVAETSNETTAAVVETAVPGTTLTTADTSSSESAAKQALTPELNKRASMEDEASSPDKKIHDPYPSTPPMSYGMPQQHQKAYKEMMAQRRSSNEEAMQARREHMQKMHEYRAAVLKRIEQDRLDMYKRMQEIEREHQRRLDQQMNWMELEEKRLMNRPI